MKVSIIIPIYNVAKYVTACLNSVFNQTYKDLEVILIDDCGQDNSMEIVHNFVESHPQPFPIRILYHKQNRGLSAARNTGINAAEGDFIYFLDSDDIIASNCIEYLMEPFLNEPNLDFVIADYQVIGSDKLYPPLLLKQGKILGNENILNAFVSGQWYMMAVNKLLNRKLILEKELYFKEGLLHEDMLWSFQLACVADSMYVIRKQTYLYYIHENSITTNFSSRNFVAYSNIVSEFNKLVKQYNLRENIEVFHFVEGVKISTFLKKIEVHYPDTLYTIYLNYRNDVIFPSLKSLRNKLSRLFWHFQYYFPARVGYIYCLCITHLFYYLKMKNGK